MADSTPTLPASATHALVAFCGAGAMLLACTVLNLWSPVHDIAYQALIVMGCSALGVFVPDLLWQQVWRRQLQSQPGAADWPRVFTKLVGLAGGIGFIALLYWLFPEYYRGEGFYGHYWKALQLIALPWALLTIPYLYWVDRRLAQPRDGLWQTGRLLLGRWQGLDGRVIGQFFLGWLVKGFFLPLMFTYLCDNLDKLLHYDLKLLHSFSGVYEWLYFTLYFIDVALVSMTYLMSLKATDTHIRSTEPTGLGWASALLCYQPFWSLIGGQYLDYDNGTRPWGQWFGGSFFYYVWGVLILLLVVIYVWATIAFGARFSNLTHRGIITNGPYRYTRHPAYVSKNLSWWLISMPFMITGSWAEALRRCLLLLLLNFIYFVRAKTEERHLSLDPVYVQYSRWMDEHGALRRFTRVPLLGWLMRWRPTFSAYAAPAFSDPPPEPAGRAATASGSDKRTQSRRR